MFLVKGLLSWLKRTVENQKTIVHCLQTTVINTKWKSFIDCICTLKFLEQSQATSQRRSERVSSLLQKIKAKREVKTELDDNLHPSATTVPLGSEVVADTCSRSTEMADNFDVLLAK
jgi:hypothetical protein